MEFPFNINNLFANEISLLDRSFTPYISNYETLRERKDDLKKVIDEMGKASAKAQNLHGPITSASRLAQSAHHLYVKKDKEANNGKGSVVGFLKVGHKKLFIYDANGVQHELEPLCVLDFYVCELCQRQGSGRQLFDAMLQEENVHPLALAIDRPSQKCLSFLSKHYNLSSVIPQVNNFVVFNGFFRHGVQSSKRSNQRNTSQSVLQQQGSFNMPNQLTLGRNNPSEVRNVHFGEDRPSGLSQQRPEQRLEGGHQNDVPWHGSARMRPPSGRDSRPSSVLPQNQQSHLSMGAHQAMYSRHQVAVPLLNDDGTTAIDTTTNCINTTKNQQRDSSPPLLPRDGPPADYLRMMGNSNFLDRHGHLRIGPPYSSVSDTGNLCDSSGLRNLRQHNQDTAFNIFGIPKLPLKSVNANNPPHRRTAFW